jgi:hypothetical protein
LTAAVRQLLPAKQWLIEFAVQLGVLLSYIAGDRHLSTGHSLYFITGQSYKMAFYPPSSNRTFIVVFSILKQYFRYYRPPFIMGLSLKHLNLYKQNDLIIIVIWI